MKIVFYSDRNLEYLARALVESIKIQDSSIEMVYYTVGFESSMKQDKVRTKYWPVNKDVPKYEFYKPGILLDLLKDEKEFLFLDVDILVGRRFELSRFKHEYSYPLASIGNWDKPFYYVAYPDGHRDIYDESRLMQYLGVAKQTMSYVYTCLLSVNSLCRDFLEEWQSFCENKYLLSKDRFYYPFPDETPFNVLMWKRGYEVNYNRIYLNTLKLEPLVFVEETDNFSGNVFDIPEQFCFDSSKVVFYHGMKDESSVSKALDYFKFR